jgi:hypothetical protein
VCMSKTFKIFGGLSLIRAKEPPNSGGASPKFRASQGPRV